MNQNKETLIHPTAIVDSKAELGANVEIGPYCIVGPHVKLGDRCSLRSHVVMDGHVETGPDNQFFEFSTIGTAPQDLSYQGEPTQVIIGKNNIFREYVSIHRATTKEVGITSVGDECLIMGYVHLAHDVRMGNHVIVVNYSGLAGHVHVHDNCTISGDSNAAQKVNIGRGSFIGGMTAIHKDVPPYCTAYGNRCALKGINIVGLRRMGFDHQVIAEAVTFFRSMEASNSSPRAYTSNNELMAEYEGNPIINEIAEFIQKSELGVAPFMS